MGGAGVGVIGFADGFCVIVGFAGGEVCFVFVWDSFFVD